MEGRSGRWMKRRTWIGKDSGTVDSGDMLNRLDGQQKRGKGGRGIGQHMGDNDEEDDEEEIQPANAARVESF